MDGRQKIALVTGAASGIGQACVRLLRARGWQVIGVDLRGADVDADLSNRDGRAAMAAAARAAAPGGLDLAVISAGLSHPVGGKLLAVNYFGAVASLEGVRPLLAMRAPAQAVVLVSTAAMDETDQRLIDPCLAAEEDTALAAAAALNSDLEYASSKRALGLWLRRAAVTPEWAGSGIFLNGVAPGFTLTGMTRPLIEDPALRARIEQATPRAVANFAEAEVQAEAILAIAGLTGGYVVGQILFVDGGTDALRRPEHV